MIVLADVIKCVCQLRPLPSLESYALHKLKQTYEKKKSRVNCSTATVLGQWERRCNQCVKSSKMNCSAGAADVRHFFSSWKLQSIANCSPRLVDNVGVVVNRVILYIPGVRILPFFSYLEQNKKSNEHVARFVLFRFDNVNRWTLQARRIDRNVHVGNRNLKIVGNQIWQYSLRSRVIIIYILPGKQKQCDTMIGKLSAFDVLLIVKLQQIISGIDASIIKLPKERGKERK